MYWMLLLVPGATALELARPQLLLPACCRVHGAHHCMAGPQSGNAPALARSGLPICQPVARRHSAGAVSAGDAARTCLCFADIEDVFCRACCVIGISCGTPGIPRASFLRLTFLLRGSELRSHCERGISPRTPSNGMHEGDRLCSKEEQGELYSLRRRCASCCALYRAPARQCWRRCAVSCMIHRIGPSPVRT